MRTWVIEIEKTYNLQLSSDTSTFFWRFLLHKWCQVKKKKSQLTYDIESSLDYIIWHLSTD